LAQASRVRRGDDHANNLTQKARTRLTDVCRDPWRGGALQAEKSRRRPTA